MRAGVSLSGNFDAKTIEALLKRYKSGVDAVEIGVRGLGCIIDGRLNHNRWDDIKRVLLDSDLEYTVHPPNALNLMSGKYFEKHVEAFKVCLYMASELGAKIMVYHSGIADESVNNDIEYQKLLTREIETLKGLSKIAAKYGITICIEPTDGRTKMGRGYGRSGAGIIPVVDAIDEENVGICYDVGHAYIGSKTCGFDFMDDFEKCLPYIKHLHLHDNCGIINQPHPYNYYNTKGEAFAFGFTDMHSPLGYGTIPFKEILPMLQDYQGIGILELHEFWINDFPKIFSDYKMILSCIEKGDFKTVEMLLDKAAPKPVEFEL